MRSDFIRNAERYYDPTPTEAAEEEEDSTDSIMVTAEEIDMMQNQAKELIEARTEAKVYRDLYERLLEKMTA